MSAWIVITAAHLDDYLVAAQVDALQSAALASGQSDPFTNVMHDRANYVRNRISQRITVSETSYAVPPELKSQTCWLIIEAMQNRLGLALEEDQRNMVRRAYSDLDIAGTEKLPISTPDDATTPTVQSGGGVAIVSKRSRSATGAKLDGF